MLGRGSQNPQGMGTTLGETGKIQLTTVWSFQSLVILIVPKICRWYVHKYKSVPEKCTTTSENKMKKKTILGFVLN